MAAAKGNKNAQGNTGGKTLNDRKLAAEVRSLALREIQSILEQEKLTEFKKQILLRLAPSILPRLNEHSGGFDEDDKPIPILMQMNVQPHISNPQNLSASETH